MVVLVVVLVLFSNVLVIYVYRCDPCVPCVVDLRENGSRAFSGFPNSGLIRPRLQSQVRVQVLRAPNFKF